MTLLNSNNPRIAQAHAEVIATLAAVPDEYGAVFALHDLQHELTMAVREHTQRQAMEAVARRLNRPGRRGRRAAA